MKVRNGFVSNSSSSSFIITIAEVLDKDKLLAKYGHLDIKEYLMTKEEAILNSYCGRISRDWGPGFDFNLKELDESKLYLIMDEYGPDGDSEFYSYDEDGNVDFDSYINYDIDLDFFNEKMQEIYSLPFSDKECLKHIDSGYGAGRNG